MAAGVRVGIDASNLRAGGGITHLRELLRAADPASVGVAHVTVWGGTDTMSGLPARPWLTLVHQPALDRPLPYRLAWQRLALHRLARAECDVLFSPGGTYRGPFRPFVTMSRNLLPFQERERRRYGTSWMYVKLGLLRRGQTATFQHASGVVFLNEYARACVLADTGPLAGRTAVIPHGVDDRFRLAPRPQREIAACTETDPFRLLYVSNVEVYKHQWHVVEAVSWLRREGMPLHLDLVGGGSAAARARLTAAMRRADPKGEFVHYHDAVAHAELPRHYHAADAFVYASSCENMPNILLEAMAAGLPIACSDMGPMPEMLGDAGVYFDPTEPESVAETLRRFVRSAAARGKQAQLADARSRSYSWTTCASATFAFLASFGDNRTRR